MTAGGVLAPLLLLVLASPAAALSPQAAQGRAVMERAQCTRCHDVSGAEGIKNAERDFHCVDCHTWILGTRGDAAAIAKQRETFPDWDRYLENIVHFIELPDLGTLTRRVDPTFVRRYLDGPFDLRPHLEESMIPLRLSAPEKDAVVAYLTELAGDAVKAGSAKAETLTPERVDAGRTAFVSAGCPTCHLVGNAPLMGLNAAFYTAMKARARLAPNLRYVRERIPRARLVRFMRSPQAIDPQSPMPAQAITPQQAESIADYLLAGPIHLSGAPKHARPTVQTLTRKVTYDEVHDEVLGKICVHCHMDPASNNGDGGAGNNGGLGYAGLSLNLETYAGVKAGLVRNGKRESVVEGSPPLLLDALLRRHDEALRDYRPPFGERAEPGTPTSAERPGMPLGLPPLSAEQLALVKTWLAQGAPGP